MHVEVARPADQVHGGGVHQHVLQLHVRELAAHDALTTSRHRREVSSTLALSTEVTLAAASLRQRGRRRA